VALLCAAYAGVVAIGLLTLPSPDHPIQRPWFTLMELLILAIAPAIVCLAVAMSASSATPLSSRWPRRCWPLCSIAPGPPNEEGSVDAMGVNLAYRGRGDSWMERIFFDGWDSLLRTVVIGVLAYVALVVCLRGAVRAAGLPALEEAASVVLETDGSFSVVRAGAGGP